jgi:asparagine synthase (glutamine-hydrolysing)
MCGIAGLITANIRPLDRIVQTMADALRHRGPDGDGVWSDAQAGVAFGHRRLAILDLSPAGHQPMFSANGRFVLTFNGEIYNHLDLRADLAATGFNYPYRGHSDTETILAALCRFGLDWVLDRAAGMFALAVWDRETGTLTLARDRFGEKPLYWGWAGGDLVFGSEIKALRRHPGFGGGLSDDAIAAFTRLGYIPAPWSIHSGIFKLDPGCRLDVAGPPPRQPPAAPLRPGDNLGNLRMTRFWSASQSLIDGQADPLTDETAALADLDRTLRQAVRRQMVADVPLGAFLSGGVDSSLIVALMQVQAARPVKTFTVAIENPAYDEGPEADRVARHLGTDHQSFVITGAEARDIIPLLPDLYDEPFADSSQIPTHMVSRMARSQVTVALSGDAGDEVFGGYNRYLWAPRLWARAARVPAPLRTGLARLAAAAPTGVWDAIGDRLGGPRRLGDQVRKLAACLPQARTFDDFFGNLISHWGQRAPQRPGGWPGLPNPDQGLARAFATDPVGLMMAHDLAGYLPGDVLCKVDRAAMGVGLETRVPFLDPDVFALACRLPPDLRIRNGQGKWPLRQLLARYVPPDLTDRPKTGFTVPMGDWLRGPLRPWAEDLLFGRPLIETPLACPNEVRAQWNAHLAGRPDAWPRLWVVLMLESWRRAQS